MDRIDELVFPILNALRKNPTDGESLRKLLHDTTPWGGYIPDHTGAAIVGNALFRLATTNLITLTEKTENDIGKKLSAIAESRPGNGYEVSEVLRGKEGRIVIKITPHFSSLQDVLKFSISELLDSRFSVKVRPIFGLPNTSLNSDVFVLMPFEQSMRPVYDDHIKQACQLAGLVCTRADDFFGASEIMKDIWAVIFSCRCVIADCTGRNPNVFYEMGIAHTLGKPVVMITQREEDVPFDIRHIRFIKYEFVPRGMKKFESDLHSMLKAIMSTPESENVSN